MDQRADDSGSGGGRWQQWLLYTWVLLLVALPMLLHGVESDSITVPGDILDIRMHSVIELFCGITALLIAGLIFVLSHNNHELSLNLFATGFLVMGVLDVLHGLTPPDAYPTLFIAAHTLSILFGGILFSLGAIFYYRAHRGAGPSLLLSPEATFSLVALIGLILAYELIMPGMYSGKLNGFTALAYRIHELSGTLYAFAAIVSLFFYRRMRQRLVLVVGAMLMLHAESAYLFRHSHMWDSAWWTWHYVKVGMYMGSLGVIAISLVLSLRAVQRARAIQDAINHELCQTHGQLDEMNKELRIRNSMVNASIGARSLDQTLMVVENALNEFVGASRYSLVLCAAEDAVEEYQRDLRRQILRWDVHVSSSHVSCVQKKQTVHMAGDEDVVHSCMQASGSHACVCLSLRAYDQMFGYLRMEFAGRRAVDSCKHEKLKVVAAEIGPIIHNALLHSRCTMAVAFRSALLQVTAMLSSTLEMSNVLKAVCGESTRMLGADCSGVLLARKDGEGMMLGSRCTINGVNDVLNTEEPAWFETDAGLALLDQLQKTGQPIALVKPDSPDRKPPFPLGVDGYVWSSVALFPMIEAGKLVAVMMVMRREHIPFSRNTLELGELFTEQVRLALVNAWTYEALRCTNERLRHSEYERVRGERMAVLGQMAASVAHEVRNPLSAINNCLAVLRKNSRNQCEDIIPAIEIIDDEVQRLDRLTHNFMSFGRSTRSVSTRVHLPTLVTRVCERIGRHTSHEGLLVEVRDEIKGESLAREFDQDGFQEVLWNLLLNAVQAVGDNGRVTVRLSQTRSHVFLAVSDDGPGILAENRKRIFEPFFTQRSEGAGLGLAIVHQRIEDWGGKLRIWGPPGACFALYIPIAAGPPVDIGLDV